MPFFCFYSVLDISKTLAIIINYLYTEEEIQQVTIVMMHDLLL